MVPQQEEWCWDLSAGQSDRPPSPKSLRTEGPGVGGDTEWVRVMVTTPKAVDPP